MIDRWHAELAGGAVAGLLAGALFAAAMQERDLSVEVTGIAGFDSSGLDLVAHLLLAGIGGVAFAAIFRFQPESYATTIASGVVFGLLLWVAGTLTLRPLLEGDSPTWSAAAASAGFPSLVGHLMYGAITGLGLHLGLCALAGRFPEDEHPASAEPRHRVVILGGGFGGMAAAQRLEQIYRRDPGLEITLVSRSNYLLFTPMLAEVASSALEPQHISASVRAASHGHASATPPSSRSIPRTVRWRSAPGAAGARRPCPMTT